MIKTLIFMISINFGTPFALGSQVERYRKIISKATEPHEECDRKQQKTVEHILATLQANHEAIKQIQLPTRQIAEKVSDPKKTSEIGITTRFESWKRAQQYLKDIENKTPEEAPIAWYNLSRYAEHLLFHDQMRIVESANYEVDYMTARFAGKIHSQIVSCLIDKNCTQVELNPEMKKLLAEKDSFKYAWKEYLTVAIDQKRIWLGLLEYHLNKTMEHLGFSKNSTVIRDKNTFTLPLVTGDFAGDKEVIEAAVHSIWQSSQGHKVQIKWVGNQDDGAFRLTRNPNHNGGAHVDEESQQIFLGDVQSPSEIAHEIGHALGLPDQYYRSWDSRLCRYKDEFDLSNLMSFPDSGQVLEEHWATLESNY